MLQQIQRDAQDALQGLLAEARLTPGDIVVVGCSTSEVAGERIGSASSPDIAAALVEGMLPLARQNGLYLAAQCCEHLNRALVLEWEAARLYSLPPVNVLPRPKAGGSFATAVYHALQSPCVVERLQAAAGLDIGDTLVGMHLRPVAVPVRLGLRRIGNANLVAARTRPKFIGGERAAYNPDLL